MNTTKLSREVGEVLMLPHTEETKFKSMELCQRIMEEHDKTRDTTMQITLRRWVGKLQEWYQ